LICDEVQTGIGRTGNMLASHTIKPDMVVLGKALSGGMMPVSCVLGDNKVMDLIEPGTHGSTYGGNPLGTAIVPHAVDIIESEGLLENAERRGKQFRDELKAFVHLGVLKDVRGKGLLNAIELHNEDSANRLVENMMNRGLLTKVTREGTIRMCPPLVISDMEMDNSLNIIRRCLSDL
jgi:ornithine--oxo-acid transaminase